MPASYNLALPGQESSLLYNFHPQSQVLVHMSPSSYLRWCASQYSAAQWEAYIRHLTEESASSDRQTLRQRLEQGLPLDALFLDADPTTGAVLAQEGQHRAMLAQTLGIDYVPVLVFARERGVGFVTEAEYPGVLKRLRVLFEEAPSLTRAALARLAEPDSPEAAVPAL